MQTVTAQDFLNLNVEEIQLNPEYKQINIEGEYSSTVGIARTTPTASALLQPFVDLANGSQGQCSFDDVKVELFNTKFGAAGTVYNITMPFTKIDLAGRETETTICRVGSFNSVTSDKFGLEMTVMCCSNGQFAIFGNKNERVLTRFTSNWQDISKTRIDGFLNSFTTLQTQYIDIANRMHSLKINAQIAERAIKVLRPAKLNKQGEIPSRTENVRNELNRLFVSGRGNSGETVFDLYNAVTEYENHFATRQSSGRVGEDENRRKAVLSLEFGQLSQQVMKAVETATTSVELV